LRAFENRERRKIFGPKKEEWAEGWRRMSNKELRNLYATPDIIRAIIKDEEMDETFSTHEWDEKCIQYFAWKT
jgi:hypothetical protein